MKPVDAANDAAEAVRTLIHLTFDPDAYVRPADVDAVLHGLLVAVQRLPQALTQAERWLDAAHVAGRVGHDQGDEVTETVHNVLGDLERAGREAREPALTLESAVGNSGHLTGVTPKAGAQ